MILCYLSLCSLSDGPVHGGFQDILPEQAQWPETAVATLTRSLRTQGFVPQRKYTRLQWQPLP